MESALRLATPLRQRKLGARSLECDWIGPNFDPEFPLSSPLSIGVPFMFPLPKIYLLRKDKNWIAFSCYLQLGDRVSKRPDWEYFHIFFNH